MQIVDTKTDLQMFIYDKPVTRYPVTLRTTWISIKCLRNEDKQIEELRDNASQERVTKRVRY